MKDGELFAAFDGAVAQIARITPEHHGTPVPACPGWTVADVADHLTRVHRWATGIVTTRPRERPVRDRGPRPGPADPVAAVLDGAAPLRAALAAADLDEPVYTFAGPRPTRWWLRRQAHETIVHGWDMADAAGLPTTVDPAVAVDGVDELLTALLPMTFAAGALAAGATLHLHATDHEGEWLLRVTGDGLVVTHEHAKGDVAVRGPAQDLLLLVYGRRSGGPGLETFGDADLLDRFVAAAAP